MSTLRSPTGSGPNAERSGSYPELSSRNLYSQSSDKEHVTLRNKRKQLDDNDHIKKELLDIRSQISELMSCLKEFNRSQSENFDKLSQDVTAIKEDVKDIRSTIENVTIEQNKMKIQLAAMAEFDNKTLKRIETLESNIQEFKQSALVGSVSIPCKSEDIIAEINDRTIRSKNIIIMGMPEPNSTNLRENSEQDKIEVNKLLKILDSNCPEPAKIIRLGKPFGDKNRPIKVCFASQSTAIFILRNKTKLKNLSVRIYPYQTPQQQSYFKNLKEELERRKANGEVTLSIRYVKGIPKIVEFPPKNSSTQ